MEDRAWYPAHVAAAPCSDTNTLQIHQRGGETICGLLFVWRCQDSTQVAKAFVHISRRGLKTHLKTWLSEYRHGLRTGTAGKLDTPLFCFAKCTGSRQRPNLVLGEPLTALSNATSYLILSTFCASFDEITQSYFSIAFKTAVFTISMLLGFTPNPKRQPCRILLTSSVSWWRWLHVLLNWNDDGLLIKALADNVIPAIYFTWGQIWDFVRERQGVCWDSRDASRPWSPLTLPGCEYRDVTARASGCLCRVSPVCLVGIK